MFVLLFLFFSFFFSLPHTFSFCFWGNHYGRFFSFLLFPLLIVSCCTLPVRSAVCFPPNCSTRTPTDTLMTTALCASPAARMRRGRDERRAEGAVTCGRATRACGAEHTFLSLLFSFLCGQGGQTPAAPHTQPHPAAVFLFYLFDGCVLPPCVIVEVGAVPHVSLPSSCASYCVDVPPCAPLLFCSSSKHTDIRYYTVLCRNALCDGGTLACIPCRNGEAAACVRAVVITVPSDGYVWDAFCIEFVAG
ncbi:ATPase [Trypanosoma cruzi]|uniref:ATPase n=1 Tax=Trypanosoma cruzi TaxID=5693 RepID=A0A7J6XMK2_TRYCR|nr:ATPase [Trypanosoma cruzi]